MELTRFASYTSRRPLLFIFVQAAKEIDMTKNRWIAWSLALASVSGIPALAQTQFPTAPTIPQVVPPPAANSADGLAVTELKIALQKAQIQSALAERVAQVKEDMLKTIQTRAGASGADQEAALNAQADAIAARAAADAAKIDVASLDVQNRAGPAALQQAQNAAAPQPSGAIPPASPLVAQLMQMDFKKQQIQTNAAAQMTPLKQKIYDYLAAQQKAGAAPSEKVMDAMLDLEAAKAAQQTAALDQQMMSARMAAAGVRP
jgi:hypothetical protein